MKYMSITKCSYLLLALILIISFEDLISVFHIWVLNTIVEVTMKIVQLKQHFATMFDPKKLCFKDAKTLFGPLCHACIHVLGCWKSSDSYQVQPHYSKIDDLQSLRTNM